MNKKLQKFLAVLILLIAVIAGIIQGDFLDTIHPSSENNNILQTPDISKDTTSELQVHFIDVGQADCILLQNQGQTVLIDSGNRSDYTVIHDYLSNLNIAKIDQFILTHPHEDHIGSAAQIISNYDIGTVYMTNATTDSTVYKSLMEQLTVKKITPVYPESGDNFSIGETAFTFLGPVSAYKDLNSMSLVVRADFGSTSFLFTGDTTSQSEKDMLNANENLQADVLKVAHHGSRDSNSYVFLKEVNPVYSVISCGTDNDYGHPHEEALSRLNDVGTTLFRTDDSGTIVAVSNGSDITWNTRGKESTEAHTEDGYGLASDKDEITYSTSFIGNKNSNVFHTSDCSSLPKESNQVQFSIRQDALDAGYTPCSRCNP